MACGACECMFYCNQGCREADLKIHELECKFLKKHDDILREDIPRYLLRLYLTLQHYPEKRSKKFKIPNTNPKKHRTYDDLALTKEGIEMRRDIVEDIEIFLNDFRSSGFDYDRDIMFEHYYKIMSNTFTFSNIDMEPIGFAIYVLESVFEHSCVSNACVVYNGTNIQIVAIKDINPGEKITISYNPIEDSREDCSNLLKGSFHFNCSCISCLRNPNDG